MPRQNGKMPDQVCPDQIPDQNCSFDSSIYASFIPTVSEALASINQPKMAVSVKANFKVPTLRNIELTGPYMHNGSMATLEQVVEFYARGGNNNNPDKDSFMANMNLDTLSPVRVQARKDIVAFLKTLTDDRVRYKQAPFDHPEIRIPNGHNGDHLFVTAGHELGADLAIEEILIIPAVGENGLINPVLPFDAHLPN